MARTPSPRRSSRKNAATNTSSPTIKSPKKKTTKNVVRSPSSPSPPPLPQSKSPSRQTKSRPSPHQTPQKTPTSTTKKGRLSSELDFTPATRKALYDKETGSPLRFKLATKALFSSKRDAESVFASLPEDSQMNVTRGRGSKAAASFSRRPPSGRIPDFGFEEEDEGDDYNNNNDKDDSDFYETQKRGQRHHHVELRSNTSQLSDDVDEYIDVERLPIVKITQGSRRESLAKDMDERLDFLERQIRIEKMELELAQLHAKSSVQASPTKSSNISPFKASPSKSDVKSPKRTTTTSPPPPSLRAHTKHTSTSLNRSPSNLRKKSLSPQRFSPSPPPARRIGVDSSPPKRRMKGIGRKDLAALTKHVAIHPSVIVSTTTFEKKPRKTRVAWTDDEVDSLERGVEKYGKQWSKIHCDPALTFDTTRTEIDLKDKWRNLKNYKEFSTLAKRTYTVLTPEHTLFLNPTTMNPYRFVNKWPRDAALKAATRPEMYDGDSSTCTIYIKEIPSENFRKHPAVPVPVHVFECSRAWQQAPEHLNRLGKVQVITVPDARKVREERCINQEDMVRILEDSQQANGRC